MPPPIWSILSNVRFVFATSPPRESQKSMQDLLTQCVKARPALSEAVFELRSRYKRHWSRAAGPIRRNLRSGPRLSLARVSYHLRCKSGPRSWGRHTFLTAALRIASRRAQPARKALSCKTKRYYAPMPGQVHPISAQPKCKGGRCSRAWPLSKPRRCGTASVSSWSPRAPMSG